MLSVIRTSVGKVRGLARAIVAELKKVEAKVKAAGLWALAASVAMALLTQVQGNAHLLDGLPPQVKFVAVAAIPPLVTFIGAWAARHTPRTGAGGE